MSNQDVAMKLVQLQCRILHFEKNLFGLTTFFMDELLDVIQEELDPALKEMEKLAEKQSKLFL
jgi:hypothetical protein